MSYYKENQMIRHFPNLQELHQGMKFAAILFLAAFSCVSSLAHDQDHQKGVGQSAEVGSVCVFMDTGCPIARYHTRTLRLLHEDNPLSPPSDPVQRRLQSPPAKSKFLGVLSPTSSGVTQTALPDRQLDPGLHFFQRLG